MYQVNYQKFQKEDFDLYYKLVSNMDVMVFVSGEQLSLDQAKVRFAQILKVNEAQPMGGFFKMFHDNKFIGLAKLEAIGDDLDYVEMGCLLLREYQQLGFGSVITEDLIDLAKITGVSSNLIAKVNVENVISKKLVTKYGMQPYSENLITTNTTEIFRLKL